MNSDFLHMEKAITLLDLVLIFCDYKIVAFASFNYLFMGSVVPTVPSLLVGLYII